MKRREGEEGRRPSGTLPKDQRPFGIPYMGIVQEEWQCSVDGFLRSVMF